MPVPVATLLIGAALAGKADKHDDAACPGLPPDQRPAVAVVDPTVQAVVPDAVPGTIAAKIRTNLLTTGCFAVDLKDGAGRYAIDAILSGYSDTGKPTVLTVNGEVSEMWRAELVVVLTLTDRESDAVLTTQTVKTEGKQRVLPSRRVTSPYGAGVSAAMTEALDAAVGDITTFLVPWRERLDVPR